MYEGFLARETATRKAGKKHTIILTMLAQVPSAGVGILVLQMLEYISEVLVCAVVSS
jgi:hypothetical protein